RYPFPGKAHVDYWEDKEVFGHFLETVVGGDVPGSYGAPPRSKWWVGLFSRVAPYALPAGLFVTAVYILFHALRGFLVPKDAGNASFQFVAGNVTGFSLLLVGVTLVSRVPRLTRSWWAWLAAVLMALACCAAFPL